MDVGQSASFIQNPHEANALVQGLRPEAPLLLGSVPPPFINLSGYQSGRPAECQPHGPRESALCGAVTLIFCSLLFIN